MAGSDPTPSPFTSVRTELVEVCGDAAAVFDRLRPNGLWGKLGKQAPAAPTSARTELVKVRCDAAMVFDGLRPNGLWGKPGKQATRRP
jgi:hypothetical protein